MKMVYYGYRVGDVVQLSTSIKCENIEFKKGHFFTIHAFPPKVRINRDKHHYFVYGKDEEGNNLRPLLTEIQKL